MPVVFYYVHTVQPSEIDPLNHANNVVYVQWLQDAAVAHSAARGWPPERYLALGAGWVVRSHTIEYIHPARLGDEIVVQTWVADFKKVTSRRRYRIYRVNDGCLLAQAETLWAFVTYATGQPTRIHPEVVASFKLPEGDPPPYRPGELSLVKS
ncbi:MAG TPA: acyl-CoA thioesterase [Thermogutta sp.]|nr:acyl-CoA thioesterase [Thermogutta sp.]